jgi:uncharacterized lipoprotein YddW (UPF0748 family)
MLQKPLPWAQMFLTAAIAVIAASTPFRAAPAEQTRALWVTRTTLTSPDAIRQMVSAAEAGGFNTLIVQVRGRGDAYYSGTIEPRASELAAKPSISFRARSACRRRAITSSTAHLNG